MESQCRILVRLKDSLWSGIMPEVLSRQLIQCKGNHTCYSYLQMINLNLKTHGEAKPDPLFCWVDEPKC